MIFCLWRGGGAASHQFLCLLVFLSVIGVMNADDIVRRGTIYQHPLRDSDTIVLVRWGGRTAETVGPTNHPEKVK